MKKGWIMSSTRVCRLQFVIIIFLITGLGIIGWLSYVRRSPLGVGVPMPIVTQRDIVPAEKLTPYSNKDKHDLWSEQHEPLTEPVSPKIAVGVEGVIRRPDTTMNIEVAKRDNENEEINIRRIAESAQSMEAYLEGKDPAEVSVSWLKTRFGDPYSQTSTSLVYRFDTGLGGNEWEFQLEDAKIKRIIYRSLD